MKKLITVFNIILLGTSPAICAIVIGYLPGKENILPWWSFGIYVSWGFSISFWVLLGYLGEIRYPGIDGFLFIFMTFLFPLLYGIFLNSIWSILILEIFTYNFLSMALAVCLVMLLGPYINENKNADIKSDLRMRYQIATTQKIRSNYRMGLAGFLLFFIVLALPAIACEVVYLREMADILAQSNASYFMHEIFWLIIRYLGVSFEVYLCFNLLFPSSIFGHKYKF